jgi:hypothetical protein
VLTASTATGLLIFLPLLAALAENYGWRSVSLTVAAWRWRCFRSWHY